MNLFRLSFYILLIVGIIGIIASIIMRLYLNLIPMLLVVGSAIGVIYLTRKEP